MFSLQLSFNKVKFKPAELGNIIHLITKNAFFTCLYINKLRIILINY